MYSFAYIAIASISLPIPNPTKKPTNKQPINNMITHQFRSHQPTLSINSSLSSKNPTSDLYNVLSPK
jgi:hypothetical protein